MQTTTVTYVSQTLSFWFLSPPSVVLKSRNLQCPCEILLICKPTRAVLPPRTGRVGANWILIFKCSLSGEMRSGCRYIRKLYKISQHLTGARPRVVEPTLGISLFQTETKQNNPSNFLHTSFFLDQHFPH